MFSATDIKWVRNVKRNSGQSWAYMDDGLEDEFDLNWSSGFKGDALLPKAGEVILLFQKPDKVTNIKPQVYLTHLVTPLDDIVWDVQSINAKYRWTRRVAVIARVDTDNAIPKPSNWIFSPVNQAHSYLLKNIRIRANNESDRTETLRSEIWRLFLPYMNTNHEKYIQQQSWSYVDETNLSAVEGRLKLIQHLARERDKGIVRAAKEFAINKGLGRVKCECCEFDFFDSYGEIGKDFIECHHRIPISTGVRVTKIEDLAMVCSNCHRMLHRNFKGKFLSIKELRSMLIKSGAGESRPLL